MCLISSTPSVHRCSRLHGKKNITLLLLKMHEKCCYVICLFNIALAYIYDDICK